jgi:hypothetical protein
MEEAGTVDILDGSGAERPGDPVGIVDVLDARQGQGVHAFKTRLDTRHRATNIQLILLDLLHRP